MITYDSFEVINLVYTVACLELQVIGYVNTSELLNYINNSDTISLAKRITQYPMIF